MSEFENREREKVIHVKTKEKQSTPITNNNKPAWKTTVWVKTIIKF